MLLIALSLHWTLLNQSRQSHLACNHLGKLTLRAPVADEASWLPHLVHIASALAQQPAAPMTLPHKGHVFCAQAQHCAQVVCAIATEDYSRLVVRNQRIDVHALAEAAWAQWARVRTGRWLQRLDGHGPRRLPVRSIARHTILRPACRRHCSITSSDGRSAVVGSVAGFCLMCDDVLHDTIKACALHKTQRSRVAAIDIESVPSAHTASAAELCMTRH